MMVRIKTFVLAAAICLPAALQLAGQPLAITSPQQNDTLAGGSLLEITWTGGSCENVMIRAIWDDVSIETIAESTPNDGSCSWTIPDGHTEPMRLHIYCGEEEARVTFLREYSLGTIEVTFPDYHDTLEKGTVTTIAWNENVGDDVSIRLSPSFPTGSGPLYIRTLAESTPGDGTFEWTIPFDIPLSQGNWYVIGIHSLSDPLIYDRSPAFYFSQDGSICVDPFEPDNHIDSANLDAIPSDFTLEQENYTSIHGTIHKPGDWDHYLMQAEHPGILDIKLYGNKEFDLQLYNGAKEYVAGSFTGEKNESIYQEVTPGVYYIIVGSLVNASSCEAYNLYLNWTALPYLEVTPESRSVGQASTTTKFEVSSNEEWTAAAGASWLTGTKSSDELLTVAVEENTSFDPRSAEITISAGSAEPVTVMINQQGAPGPLFITSPQLHDTLMGGSTFEITWTGGACENVKIKAIWDDISIVTIAQSTPNDGSYLWTVLDGHTEPMALHIYCGAEEAGVGFLREYSLGTIEVTFPGYRDTLEKGTVVTITWNEDVGDDVCIKLTNAWSGGGPDYVRTLAESTPGDGSFEWTVPFDIPVSGLGYLIAVNSLSDPLIYDYSRSFYLSYKGSICVDSYEPDNHIDSASLDAIDPEFTREEENFASIHGTVHEPGDRDYYLLHVEHPGTLDLLLAHVPDEFDLQLYNGAKEYVAGSFTDGNESISEEVTPGIYYIVVGSLVNASSCDVYALYLTWTALPYLEVTPESRSVGQASTTTTFEVSSNEEWTAAADASWLTVTKSSDELLTVAVEENTSFDPRSAEITITAGSAEPVTVMINQERIFCSLEISPENRTVSPAAGITSFTVASNVEWTVSGMQEWLTVSQEEDSFRVSFENNESPNARSVRLVATGGSCSDTGLLIQTGAEPYFEVSTGMLQLGVEQGSKATFEISANVEWSFLNQLPWLSIDPVGGNTTAEVEVEALESNTTGAVRTGSLLVSGNGISHVVTVNQDFDTGIQEPGNAHSRSGSGPRIYPNPAGDLLHVDLSSPEPTVLVRIFDSRGTQVFQDKFINTGAIDLEMGRYPGGIYRIEILHGSKRSVSSFVILPQFL